MNKNLFVLTGTLCSCMFGVGISHGNKIHLEKPAIEQIRKEVQLIDSGSHYKRTEKQLPDESAEGANVVFLRSHGLIKKIIATFYGETGKAVNEYYFNDAHKLIFLLKTSFHYGHRTDKERYYFQDEKLILWISSEGRSTSQITEALHKHEQEELEHAKKLIHLEGN